MGPRRLLLAGQSWQVRYSANRFSTHSAITSSSTRPGPPAAAWPTPLPACPVQSGELVIRSSSCIPTPSPRHLPTAPVTAGKSSTVLGTAEPTRLGRSRDGRGHHPLGHGGAGTRPPLHPTRPVDDAGDPHRTPPHDHKARAPRQGHVAVGPPPEPTSSDSASPAGLTVNHRLEPGQSANSGNSAET